MRYLTVPAGQHRIAYLCHGFRVLAMRADPISGMLPTATILESGEVIPLVALGGYPAPGAPWGAVRFEAPPNVILGDLVLQVAESAADAERLARDSTSAPYPHWINRDVIGNERVIVQGTDHGGSPVELRVDSHGWLRVSRSADWIEIASGSELIDAGSQGDAHELLGPLEMDEWHALRIEVERAALGTDVAVTFAPVSGLDVPVKSVGANPSPIQVSGADQFGAMLVGPGVANAFSAAAYGTRAFSAHAVVPIAWMPSGGSVLLTWRLYGRRS